MGIVFLLRRGRLNHEVTKNTKFHEEEFVLNHEVTKNTKFHKEDFTGIL